MRLSFVLYQEKESDQAKSNARTMIASLPPFYPEKDVRRFLNIEIFFLVGTV
jgi:hypothetical protein